jgi:hypothetical protein
MNNIFSAKSGDICGALLLRRLCGAGGESQVYMKTSEGGRYIDQLVGGVANESKVGYTTLTKDITTQIAKDAEIVRKGTGGVTEAVWHFFQSPVTGKGGASQPLLDELAKNGIKAVIH